MKASLKPVVRYLLPVVFVGAVAYGALQYGLPQTLFENSTCAPITYRVGNMDERFGLSQAEFDSVLEEAASVWNTAGERTLVAASAEGEVLVSLVYSPQQRVAELGQAIDSEQAAYEEAKAETDVLHDAYQTAEYTYETLAAAYERDAAAYQAQVRYWNERGGAPSREYAALERERGVLESRERALDIRRDEVNALAETLNERVRTLNALASRTNAKVNVFNAAAHTDYDQGRYVSDEEGVRITVYEFMGRDELTRVLAHEFGHALGLDHTEDPESLMYPYNSGTGLELAEEDIEEFGRVCAS